MFEREKEVRQRGKRKKKKKGQKNSFSYRGVALDHGVEPGDDGLGQGVLLVRGCEHRPGKEGGC